ncbi:MAG: hypothetical protein ACLTXP_11810 [Odoribacter splanchnicus]
MSEYGFQSSGIRYGAKVRFTEDYNIESDVRRRINEAESGI